LPNITCFASSKRWRASHTQRDFLVLGSVETTKKVSNHGEQDRWNRDGRLVTRSPTVHCELVVIGAQNEFQKF